MQASKGESLHERAEKYLLSRNLCVCDVYIYMSVYIRGGEEARAGEGAGNFSIKMRRRCAYICRYTQLGRIGAPVSIW